MSLRLAVLVLVVAATMSSCSASSAAAVTAPVAPYVNLGTAEAVAALVERINPGSGAHFTFALAETCPGSAPPCFTLADAGGKIKVTGTGAAELAYGVGHYMREYCNMTIGWKRGGGSNVWIPTSWPKVGATPVSMKRNTPWSYMMNVCTHSYSLVWYSWQDWEEFIDWMAVSGINLFLGMTGQEEVQYKVFEQFGLNDTTIRSWFNGPALLTWSRGQNEYGSHIGGPLPRSWMKQQWNMMKQITVRYRSLGMSSQLPAFQGNAPVAIKAIHGDANMTDNKKDTAWMNSVDPLYAKIADAWMQTIIADFGTDHWYQLDGYFNGGTAPWLDAQLDEAPAADPEGPAADLPGWYERGVAAYTGLNRTDPEAIWSFQGWAFVGWNSDQQRDSLKSFIDATPAGKFNVIDMSVNGEGEWHKWTNGTGLWSAADKGQFIWTTLHDFGGTDGLKGELARINNIPFEALEAKSNVWGTGFTPEGIDQNPVYYEFMLGCNWRDARVADITQHIVDRSHRRYNLAAELPAVTEAWSLLVNSSYAQDLSVQDGTGVPHLGSNEAWPWESDNHTPTALMCMVYTAWTKLIEAAASIKTAEPFRYDLVNTGREVLAQLAGPAGKNFTAAIGGEALDVAAVQKTGEFYVGVLNDIDELVNTDSAFQIGPWIKMAKAFADMEGTAGVEDCTEGVGAAAWPTITSCVKFYEWNSRTQLTTWNPTAKGQPIPGGPVDYASKHWAGLIKDYYGYRVTLVLREALAAAAAGKPLDTGAVNSIKAEHAYNWTTATNAYATEPVGDYVAVSKAMQAKYAGFFATCSA